MFPILNFRQEIFLEINTEEIKLCQLKQLTHMFSS